ncbi:MAG: GNAT family N-acetyltransferase [Melioribacteraceae bacterium]
MKAGLKKTDIIISTDRRKLQTGKIHKFLTEAYWSKGISAGRVKKAIAGSICFGVYLKKKQIGFARVISDKTSLAYIADLFIIEEYRGRGLSKLLVKSILNHHELSEVKAWMLATKDAHGLYAKFGFKALSEPAKFMRMQNPKPAAE